MAKIAILLTKLAEKKSKTKKPSYHNRLRFTGILHSIVLYILHLKLRSNVSVSS